MSRSPTEESDLEKIAIRTPQGGESPHQGHEAGVKPDGRELVEWDGPDDPQNPQNWSLLRHWWMIGLVSAVTFNISMASTVTAPAVPLIMERFKNNSSELESFVVSVCIIGFVFGPLVVAPLSELYGHAVILHTTNILFLVFTIASAVSTNLGMFIAFRLLMGLVACIPLTLGGPVIGGYLAKGAGWQWVFWLVAILSGVLTILCLVSIPETYAPVLLIRKAARLRKETGNPKLHSVFDNPKSPLCTFATAIFRPTKMLLFAPIATIMALYIALIYGYMYLLFTTFTFIFIDQYGFNSGQAGLAYLGVGVGSILGLSATGFYSDAIVKKKRQGGVSKPEEHLIPLIFGAFLVPMSFFFYGWAAYYKIHWIVPIIATGLFGLGMLCAFMPVQLYLVETYTIYAASAIASNTVLRSILGAVLPLAGPEDELSA
ncbi:uncharacterized transporter C1529.01 [Aspergillus udagawae]|uniref:Uncharacterized transporter C1529.01 n=1 Tax=Aspergillus udagawae TaxID=91492 RepID=A0ABQ1BET6_9EURO|nr:uncharacterized transporter C1529.01 [Aspergillus udagawae]GFG00259.1 uncharacterized transporter C1529.01 [Aspergillus udagawae]